MLNNKIVDHIMQQIKNLFSQKKVSFIFLSFFAVITVFGIHYFRSKIALKAYSQDSNILTNGGFESGDFTGYGQNQYFSIQGQIVNSGQYAARLNGAGTITQGWLTLQDNTKYKLCGNIRIDSQTGGSWGGVRISVVNKSWSTLASTNYLTTSNVTVAQWSKYCISFTTTNQQVLVQIGTHTDRTFTAYFDDFVLLDNSADNIAPVISSIQANKTSGVIGDTFTFQAQADDPDGVVEVYAWYFDDGGYDNSLTPSHNFYLRGDHTVTLVVYDDDGTSSEKSMNITISDSQSPHVSITSPTTNATFTTSNDSITLHGSASDNSRIDSLVWDNVNTGNSSSISLSPSSSVSWSSSSISLKPGKNEILITAEDNSGLISTDSITVNRTINAPIVSNITINKNTINAYEKFEITFNLQTTADYLFFPYEENPPSGIEPKSGVTVEGVFTTPSGIEIRQPGFYETDVNLDGSWQDGIYTETPNQHWMIRLAPQEQGQWDFDIEVKDASGTSRVNGGNFTVNPPSRNGFVQVSTSDPRYFEFSNGSLYYPMGPIKTDYVVNNANGMNFSRPWMGGKGAYSTNWSRWLSSAERHGNEGVMTRLNYNEHYPGHDVSYEIFYPEGFRTWITTWGNTSFGARFKPNTSYHVTLRYKAVNIEGPRNALYPYGFVVKTHGWLSQETDIDTTEATFRNKPRIIDYITTNQDWHTIVTTFTTGSTVENNISLYVDNVTNGQVYIDEFSIKEILSDQTLGGELIRDPLADQHTYVDQRAARYFDKQVQAGEQNNISFKFVVQDKNDWIPNHLLRLGIFYKKGNGYYQENGTKARFLQQAWWRYLIARWGYSTAVHSWELNNEGDPNDTSHYRATQDFAKFMHENDYHPHLATTSLWCCWRPDLWANQDSYPDIDYADVHEYVNEADENYYDLANWVYTRSTTFYQDMNNRVLKPVLLAETGMPNTSFFHNLTDSTWWHNLMWSQVNYGGMSLPNYWYPSHLDQINYQTVIKSYTKFMSGLPINNGYYKDAEAQVSNNSLRAWGQKDVVHGGLHLWVQNKNHTWKNVTDGVSIPSQSGVITVTGFEPNTHFTVEWWNTWGSAENNWESVKDHEEVKVVDANGVITLNVNALQNDLAIRIVPEGGNVLLGDIDTDGDVDRDDALFILNNWGKAGSTDANSDGLINDLDFGYVVADWGKTT